MKLAEGVPCPTCNARRGSPCTEAFEVDPFTASWRAIEPHNERLQRIDHQLLAAFGQGQSARRKDGYLSDNPHGYETPQWEAWRAGFQER